MPAALTPDASEDLASRFALWNPSITQLEAITEAPAAAMEEDGPAEEDVFSAQIRKEVAKLQNWEKNPATFASYSGRLQLELWEVSSTKYMHGQ